MHDARRAGHAGIQRDKKFATRGDIKQQTFFVSQARHRPTQKRLRRINDSLLAERPNRLLTSRTQMIFVVDESRRAIFGGKRHKIATADF